MKTLHLLIIGIVAVFISSPATAELIIYKGTLKQSAVGLGVTRKVNSQFYLIVDHDTANVTQIQYATVNKTKEYATTTETNLHFVQISAPKGKVNEAIAHAPSDCDVNEGNTSDGVFVQGVDSVLKVNSNSTITFPKILSGGGKDIDYSSGQPIYVESTLVLSFDASQTPLSNRNGETLDQALARIASNLENQGYNQQSERKNSSRHPLNLDFRSFPSNM